MTEPTITSMCYVKVTLLLNSTTFYLLVQLNRKRVFRHLQVRNQGFDTNYQASETRKASNKERSLTSTTTWTDDPDSPGDPAASAAEKREQNYAFRDRIAVTKVCDEDMMDVLQVTQDGIFLECILAS